MCLCAGARRPRNAAPRDAVTGARRRPTRPPTPRCPPPRFHPCRFPPLPTSTRPTSSQSFSGITGISGKPCAVTFHLCAKRRACGFRCFKQLDKNYCSLLPWSLCYVQKPFFSHILAFKSCSCLRVLSVSFSWNVLP